MKKKDSRESRLLPTAPTCASDLTARVELTPPTSNLPEVEEKVTQAKIFDIGRYLQWADKTMAGPSKKRKSKKPKAALMEVAMRTTNLRIEIVGQAISDYRITDRDLEFRALDSGGRGFSDQRSTWRRLTASELLLHLRLETVVGNWFIENIRESEELQATAA